MGEPEGRVREGQEAAGELRVGGRRRRRRRHCRSRKKVPGGEILAKAFIPVPLKYLCYAGTQAFLFELTIFNQSELNFSFLLLILCK